MRASSATNATVTIAVKAANARRNSSITLPTDPCRSDFAINRNTVAPNGEKLPHNGASWLCGRELEHTSAELNLGFAILRG